MKILPLLPLIVSLAEAQGSVEEILTRIQANLAEYKATVPSFAADESVTSPRVVNGAVRQESVSSALFTCRVKARSDRQWFGETHEVITMNGKPARKTQQLSGPFIVRGAFLSLLDATFDAENIPFQNYRVVGMETLAGRKALVLAFETKPGQTHLRFMMNGKSYATNDTGRAWLDTESMQLLQIERKYSDMPSDEIVVTVAYFSSTIDGKTFWLPKTVTSSDKR